MDRLNRNHDDEERNKLLQWLSPINYGAEQTDFVSRRQEGTAQWFLDSSEYQNWLQTPKQTLFCPGIPGAGKTILSSVVVEELISRYGEDSTVGIAFLYCNFRRTHEQKLTDLLASLLRQLVNGLPSVPHSVTALRNKHKHNDTRPSMTELTKLLHEVASMFSRVFVVADGLDECQTANACRATFIEEIFDLQAKCDVNIFATARFIPEITEKFNECTTLEIRASRADIESFLDGNIVKLSAASDWDRPTRDLIKITISEVVDGMFLLAQLYLRSLDGKTTLRAVKNALKGLQRQDVKSSDAQRNNVLDLAYDDAMKRINEQTPDFRDLAIRILFWITLSEAPLKALELQYALSIEPSDITLAEDNIQTVRRMLSVCAGLVTVDPESDVIRLVHYTTQEYFERKCDIWFPSDAQSQMAGACMTYLCFGCLPGSNHEESYGFLGIPFCNYAASNWGKHASKANQLSPDAVRFFMSTKAMTRIGTAMRFAFTYIKYPAIKHTADDGSYTQAMATHTSVFYNAESAVSLLIHSGADFNLRDEHGRTPLTWAASEGFENIVRLLVESGNGLMDKTAKHIKPPLSYAAESGHEAVFKYLLARGDVGPDWSDHYKTTPLSYAAQSGHEAIVRLLLARDDVVADSTDENSKTPLAKAAEGGHEAIVRLLLARGDVNPNWSDRFKTTPLAYAAEKGHDTIVKLLLAREDVIPDFADGYQKTPLIKAAERGHEKVVRLLLAQDGVDPNSKCTHGMTPLHYAAKSGKTAVVRELIRSGKIDPNTVDKRGKAPLHHATWERHTDTVEFLLGIEGIDASKTDPDGRTPLSMAAVFGSQEIILLLLKRDEIRSSVKSGCGPIAASLAKVYRHTSIEESIKKAMMAFED